MYADACGLRRATAPAQLPALHQPVNYTGGKARGDPINLSVTFKVLGAGAPERLRDDLRLLGSSYRYNDDGGAEPNLLSLTATFTLPLLQTRR